MPRINLRPNAATDGELRQLLDATDAQAEEFITACVHFALYMQTQVEFGVAHDVLEAMKEETYARLRYYEGRIDPISGKLKPDADLEQPKSTTARFMR